MSDMDPETQPVPQPVPPPPPLPAPAAGAAVAPPPPPRTPLRDRLFGLWALVAVAVAGVVLGGLAGFGISAATGGDERDGRMGQFGPGGPGGFHNGPGGVPGGGQLPQPPLGAPTQVPAPTAAPPTP